MAQRASGVMRSVFSVMSFLPIIVCEFACGVAESSATVAIAMNFFIGFGFISVEFCFFFFIRGAFARVEETFF